MNVRVFLLVMVTAGFMAVWDADCPVTATAVRSRSKNHIHHSPTVEGQRLQAHGDLVAAGTEKVIPLPKSLTPGVWQAVSSGGEAFTIAIERSARPSGTLSTSTQQSFVVTEDGLHSVSGANGMQWCFLQLQPQSSRQAARESGHKLRRAARQ